MAGGETELLDDAHPTSATTPIPATAPTSAAVPGWPSLERLPGELAASASPAAWRARLREANEELKQRFLSGDPVEYLVHARAAVIDTVLRQAWRIHCSAEPTWALVAVGGYGRG